MINVRLQLKIYGGYYCKAIPMPPLLRANSTFRLLNFAVCALIGNYEIQQSLTRSLLLGLFRLYRHKSQVVTKFPFPIFIV